MLKKYGGEGGIRTHDRVLPYTRLAGERLQPTRPPLRENSKFQIPNSKLQITNYKLQITNYK